MGKVRCKFCNFETDGRCAAKKGATVKVSKKRVCSSYVGNEDKIVEFLDRRQSDSYPKATMRPSWWWDRQARRAARKAALEKLAHQKTEQTQPMTTPDKSHPLTGDLSRFTQSTVQDAE